MDPQPISYATPASRDTRTDGSPVLTSATVGWRTVAAAAWLVVVLATIVGALQLVCDQQQSMASILGGQQFWPIGTVSDLAGLVYNGLRLILGPVAVGVLAAALFYGWSTTRLAWAAALPIVASFWSALMILAPQAASQGTISTLSVAAVVQAGLIYAGTHLGRPFARWLTRQLVPPPLRASLIALWL